MREDLRHLLGRPAAAGEIDNARTLLARVLDLPAGLPIMTIHGFCQSLLRRFPLEAGVPAHFDVIEPRTAADLLREARERGAGEPPRRRSGRTSPTLAVLLGESTLADGLAALREQRLRARRRSRRRRGAGRKALPHARPGRRTPRRRRCARRPAPIRRSTAGALQAACRALEFGSDGDRERCARISAWLAADLADRHAALPGLRGVFLTGDRAPKAQSGVITGPGGDGRGARRRCWPSRTRLAAWAERAKAARDRRAHRGAAAGRRRPCSSAMRSARRGLQRSTTTT